MSICQREQSWARSVLSKKEVLAVPRPVSGSREAVDLHRVPGPGPHACEAVLQICTEQRVSDSAPDVGYCQSIWETDGVAALRSAWGPHAQATGAVSLHNLCPVQPCPVPLCSVPPGAGHQPRAGFHCRNCQWSQWCFPPFRELVAKHLPATTCTLSWRKGEGGNNPI